MKMIKKISAILLIILLFSTSMTVVSAESVYANIENISTMVEIPDSFIVTSANVTPGNTVTYSANATTADSSKSLVITSERYNKTEDIYNFKYLNKQQVNDEVKNILNGNSTLCNRNFSNVISASFKETDNYIVFMLYNSDILNNTNVSYATAYTVINGEIITIKYVSNNKTLTIDEKSLFNKIIDSITVSELYIKPKSIDMAGIFSTLFIVIIFITIAVAVCVVIYYNSSTRKIHRKESRQLADKYYDELKNEGLMEENQSSSESIDSNDSANTVKTANSNNTSSVLNVFEKPSLIEDEWEDIDLEKMFSTSSSSASNENIDTENNMETYEDEDVLYLDKAETLAYSQENTDSYEPAESSQDNNFVSKAESAKRFAQMYIGNNHKQDNNVEDNDSQLEDFNKPNESDDENIAPEVLRRIEERQRQRRLNNRKKRKNSSKRRKSGNSKSSSNKTTTKRRKTENKNYSSDPFADFQLDGYWDKYR